MKVMLFASGDQTGPPLSLGLLVRFVSPVRLLPARELSSYPSRLKSNSIRSLLLGSVHSCAKLVFRFKGNTTDERFSIAIMLNRSGCKIAWLLSPLQTNFGVPGDWACKSALLRR